MKKSKNVPEIRFEGFTEDWEQRKLGELVSFSKGSGYSKSDLNENGTPIILYGRLYTKYKTVISDVDTFVNPKENSVYSKGGEVIVPASGETAEDISIASVVEKSGVILGGDLNVITTPNDIDSAFLAISISNGKPHNDMAKMAQGKSVVHLHNPDLAKIDFPYPSYEEQRKISEYFSGIDNIITFHQRKRDKLLDLKNSMLYKLFPKEGDNKPELRFQGFTDDWSKKKLGDCFSERTESFPDGELLSVTINDGIKKFSELNRNDNSNENKSKYKKVYVGDIAYNSMRMWQGASGYSPYEGIVSPAYTVLQPNEGIDSKCFSYLFKRPDIVHMFQLYSKGITSDTWNLKYPEFKELEIYVSEDYEEQKLIGQYLSKLDSIIDLNNEKLKKLEHIKSYLLDKMFV